MSWQIYSILSRAAIGSMAGAFTAIFVWIILLLKKEGSSTTWRLIKEMEPIISEDKFSSQWLIKTGAFPAAVIGIITAPYLGPIVGQYLWLILERIIRATPGTGFVTIGSLVIGLIAGVLGYLLRVPEI